MNIISEVMNEYQEQSSAPGKRMVVFAVIAFLFVCFSAVLQIISLVLTLLIQHGIK